MGWELICNLIAKGKGKGAYIYIAPLLVIGTQERSGTVRVLLGSHSVTCHPHTFIRDGMSRTWEFTSAIFNQQSPTDLLVATNLPTNEWMTGLVGLRLVFPGQSPIQVQTAPSAA